MIDQQSVVVDPRRDLKVVIEPSLGFKGGEMTFEKPLEPITALVAQTVGDIGGWEESHFDNCFEMRGDDYIITGWDPATHELRVKLQKGAFNA